MIALHLVCDCPGWIDSYHRMSAAFAFVQDIGKPCGHQPFQFCPWCGSRLVKKGVEMGDGWKIYPDDFVSNQSTREINECS